MLCRKCSSADRLGRIGLPSSRSVEIWKTMERSGSMEILMQASTLAEASSS
jgi:hypothetical protein